MSSAVVRFRFQPGVERALFQRVRLCGNWGADGAWVETPMQPIADATGRPAFEADVTFAGEDVGRLFEWGVLVDRDAEKNLWAIAAESEFPATGPRHCAFFLKAGEQVQSYALTHCGDIGAVRTPNGLRFAVWAKNALNVELVLADPAHGYVADDGTGAVQRFAMTNDNGVWSVGPDGFGDFAAMVGQPYMFHITREDGSKAYRTDLWSRMQIGAGDFNPKGAPYSGSPRDLEGPQSCSLVCDPDLVTLADGRTLPAAQFWADEHDPARPLPRRFEDLVIYELHVGALGFGSADPGTLDDAIRFIDHLERLGVNAVELLPIAEFQGKKSWGYGTSHFFAIEESAGGVDRLKEFVKACHRRGIAVILDVCYNHFDQDAERAEWQYDSTDPTHNMYYWYEGRPEDYSFREGGYIDNESSGWAPRFSEEMVRQLFISSAVHLVETCHIDGFRLDQTTSIHAYPKLKANGDFARHAAAAGLAFLKQWTRTMRLVKPSLFLFAEDYSGWSALTEPSLNGDGLGFDATWFGDFHHNLIEYKDSGAHLIKEAGINLTGPLKMSWFEGALRASGSGRVVYNESHDDCGNRTGSARTIALAVNHAPLIGETRRWAEARVRFAAAMTLLSAGTPMFFMGEEVGAQRLYTHDTFMANREDILGLASGDGAALIGFYRDLIALSKNSPGIRSRSLEPVWYDEANRVIAFLRTDGTQTFFVAGNLSNAPFDHGYRFSSDSFGDADWIEALNSDAGKYGGWGVGNGAGARHSSNRVLEIVLPASGAVVMKRV